MKTLLDLFRRRFRFRLWLLLAALAASLPAAGAGLTVEVHLYNNLYNDINSDYFVFSYLSLNSMPGDLAVGTYTITTPQSAPAGSSLQYQYDGANLNYLGGGAGGCNDFPTLLQSVTNGNWTLVVTNATITNTYLFTVSAPVLPAGLLPGVVITFPVQGASNVVNQPDFTWEGPSSWQGTISVDDYTNDASGNGYTVASATLPPTQTSWLSPVPLPNGTNNFGVNYVSNTTAFIVASVPTNSSSVSLPGWVSTSFLETYTGLNFSVGATQTGPVTRGHSLVAHYTFDNNDVSGTDSSGNGNNFVGGPSYWGPDSPQSSYDAIAGGSAIQFFGDSALSALYVRPGTLYSNLVSTLAGSFSVSLWLNTASITGNDNDPARNGAIVMDAYNDFPPGADGVIPVAITGSKLAFYTGDAAGAGSTLHSITSVVNNNDTYVHVVVTRDQTTGQKLIYINGAMDAAGAGSVDYLNGDTNYFSIGGTSGAGYTGLLDDVQIYSGVLSGTEVSSLFQNPGTTVANASGDGIVAYYDFDEGAVTAADVSGHGNNLVLAGSFGSGNGPTISSPGVSGAGSISFDGGSFVSAPSSLLPVLAGTFSLSVWVNTGQTTGQQGNGFLGQGAGIVAADVPGAAEDLVPVGLCAGLIDFNTGGSGDDNLYSFTPVNDNNWHHVVVTRDQSTGIKQIFIDGSLDTSDTENTDLLNAPQLLVLGCVTDAGNPDPSSPSQNGYDGYNGLIDDLQIYDRVLSPGEVAFLDQYPGVPVANTHIPSSGIEAYYDFDEGAAQAADVSGNGNNLVFAGNFGGNGPILSSPGVSGAGAVSFDGGSFLTAPPTLLSVLASNFSISLWINTQQNMGTAGGGFLGGGAGIVAADVPGDADDLVPVCLTGGVIGFFTGGIEDTLYSSTPVNDNAWHHVVVTRNQRTGCKQIFIDGTLDVSDTATTDLLNTPQLLVLGCDADASNPDPASPEWSGQDGYVGLLDDLQIYNRVLTAGDVMYLDTNPGQTLTNTVVPLNYTPASVDLTFSISRSEDPVNGEYYLLFPSISVASPALITSNYVQSPNGTFYADQNGSTSYLVGTLDEVINDCTNGQWQLFVNKGDPSQQYFTFTLSNNGLTTNILSPVTIFSPTNTGINIATTPAFSWAGPANFANVFVNVFQPGGANEGNINLPGTTTTWPSPPTLQYGTNRFEVSFTTNDTSQVTLTTPVYQVGTALAGFTTHVDLTSVAASIFLVGAPIAAVELSNLQSAGGTTQFQFLSQIGVTGTVQSRTNLTLGNWEPRGDIMGDGTMQSVSIPATNGPVEFYRVLSHY